MRGSKHLGGVLWHEAMYQDGITTLSSVFFPGRSGQLFNLALHSTAATLRVFRGYQPH